MSSHPHPYSSLSDGEVSFLFLYSKVHICHLHYVDSTPVSRHVNTMFSLERQPVKSLPLITNLKVYSIKSCLPLWYFWYNVMSLHYTSLNDLSFSWLVCTDLIIIIFYQLLLLIANFSSVDMYFCHCLMSAAAILSHSAFRKYFFFIFFFKMRCLSIKSGFCASLLKCSPSV